MSTAFILGLLQGITEWLPISSEGVVAAAYSLMRGGDFSEAVSFAIWLHIGTALSVLVAYRREINGIVRRLAVHPRTSSSPDKESSGFPSNQSIATEDLGHDQYHASYFRNPLLRFLIIATFFSAFVGWPLLFGLEAFLWSISFGNVGAIAMIIIGGAMMVTGALQIRRRNVGTRTATDVGIVDAALTGIVQGLAVVPGLSRSGLTVSVLLARNIDRREALVLSYLLSVPVSLGAALFVGLKDGFAVSSESVVAALVAFVVGLGSLRILTAVAQRVNFGLFVLVVGVAMIGGGLWEFVQ